MAASMPMPESLSIYTVKTSIKAFLVAEKHAHVLP